MRAIGAAICMAFLAGCTLGTSESVTEDSEVILVEQTEPATEPATEPHEPDPLWYVTAYADASGNQGMFYTIYNEAQGALIVVDGGWEANTEQVRSVIRSMGGVVDAWIVTHYHNDHVDAFTGIYRDPQGIEIRAVYDSPMDYEAYLAVAQWWDAPASYTAYREAVGTSELVHHVVRDETIVIDGLMFEFFNTYDELTSGLGDVPNNASLVFKVTNEEESMLFTADCHSAAVAELLIGRYGERLRADYYQAPHHGNSTNWQAMIEAVQPRVTFLDGPAWLMTGESYRAKDLIAYCEAQGLEYRTYADAPSSVVLR